MPYDLIDEGKEPDFGDFLAEVGKALMRAGGHLQRELSTAPSKKPGTKHLAGPLPGGFYSLKQRAFVIGGIKAGTLKVPYMRTGNLERSWSVSAPELEGGDLVVYVYSDPSEAPYNEWVQQGDPDANRKQVLMHKDWPTPESTRKKVDNEVSKEIVTVLEKWGFE